PVTTSGAHRPLQLGLGHQALLDRRQLREEVPGELLGGGEIVGDGSSRRLAPPVPRGLPERVEDLGDRTLEVLDVPSHEKKLPLDLLDGQILRHHVADALDLADDRRRIHALRSLMLTLATHPDAPREQAELDVLPQGGLAELDGVRGPSVEDLLRRDPLRVLALEAVEQLVGDPLQGFLPEGPRGPTAPSTEPNVFHSVESRQFEGARLLPSGSEMRQGAAFRSRDRTLYDPQTG